MNRCPNCNTAIEEGFDACWNCSYDFAERSVAETSKDNKYASGRRSPALYCLRCGAEMIYLGNYNFHEGTRAGVFGNLFELFVNRESFDIHACRKCGKAEFFIPL